MPLRSAVVGYGGGVSENWLLGHQVTFSGEPGDTWMVFGSIDHYSGSGAIVTVAYVGEPAARTVEFTGSGTMTFYEGDAYQGVAAIKVNFS